MPNVRRPDRLSISLADKAARAITELTRDNDWLEIRLARLETENRDLRMQVEHWRAAHDDNRVRSQRARTDGVFSRVGVAKPRTSQTSTGTNGEQR